MTGRRGLLDPSEIAPLELDLRRVFWVFIALWAVALVGVGVAAVVGDVPGRTVAICATGFGLGFVALAWERWRFGPREARTAASDAGPGAGPGPGPGAGPNEPTDS